MNIVGIFLTSLIIPGILPLIGGALLASQKYNPAIIILIFYGIILIGLSDSRKIDPGRTFIFFPIVLISNLLAFIIGYLIGWPLI